MSTVGRIGWMRALTKVLTRSRGTPAAALAMYCSRKVLVDTELSDYNASGDAVISRSGDRSPRSPDHPITRSIWEVRPGIGRNPDVLVDRAWDAGVDRAGAADRRAQVNDVWLRVIRVVCVHPL